MGEVGVVVRQVCTALPSLTPWPPLEPAVLLHCPPPHGQARSRSGSGSFHPPHLLFHTPLALWTCPQLPLSLALGRSFGQGLLRLGGVPPPLPCPASLILSSRVSWPWPPSRLLLLILLPCCSSAAASASSLPPHTALISICQQLVEGQTDTLLLQPSPLPASY